MTLRTGTRPLCFFLSRGVLHWALIFCLVSEASTQPPETAEALVTKLQATHQKIATLEADFTQTTHYEGFDTAVVSTGHLFFKPGKMRWDYIEPTPQQIFVEGDTIFYVMPEQQQVMKGTLGQESGLPIALFLQTARMDHHFTISLPAPSARYSKSPSLILIPKRPHLSQGPRPSLEKITLTLMPAPDLDGLMIQGVSLHEAQGNLSSFTFKKISVNKRLPPDTFLLKIPEGSEWVEMP